MSPGLEEQHKARPESLWHSQWGQSQVANRRAKWATWSYDPLWKFGFKCGCCEKILSTFNIILEFKTTIIYMLKENHYLYIFLILMQLIIKIFSSGVVREGGTSSAKDIDDIIIRVPWTQWVFPCLWWHDSVGYMLHTPNEVFNLFFSFIFK